MNVDRRSFLKISSLLSAGLIVDSSITNAGESTSSINESNVVSKQYAIYDMEEKCFLINDKEIPQKCNNIHLSHAKDYLNRTKSNPSDMKLIYPEYSDENYELEEHNIIFDDHHYLCSDYYGTNEIESDSPGIALITNDIKIFYNYNHAIETCKFILKCYDFEQEEDETFEEALSRYSLVILELKDLTIMRPVVYCLPTDKQRDILDV